MPKSTRPGMDGGLVPGSVPGSEAEPATNLAIIERMKSACNVKTDTALAKAIGISQAAISKAKTKGKVPADWIITISNIFEVSADWLLYGKGAVLLEGKEAPMVDANKNSNGELDQLRHKNRALMEEVTALMRDKNDLLGQLYEKAIDPERDFVIPVQGLVECRITGWYAIAKTTFHTVAPVDVAQSKGAFCAMAIGDSMIPAGIEPGFLVFCDPTIEPHEGDAVFVERTDGHATIKIFKGESVVGGTDMIHLQGWQPRSDKTSEQPQEPFELQEPRETIKRVSVVVYVKRRP